MDYGLKGKTAIVTGGGRGLGGGISEVLASEGANVIVADRSQADDSDELVARLNNQYGVKAVFSFLTRVSRFARSAVKTFRQSTRT